MVKVIGSNIGPSGETDRETAKSTANVTKEYWNRVTRFIKYIYLKEDRERGTVYDGRPDHDGNPDQFCWVQKGRVGVLNDGSGAW